LIVFIANYPIGDETKEGMAQRILSIDDASKEQKRVYLNLSFKKNWKRKEKKFNGISILNLNSFLHIFTILSYLIKADFIYIHSIFNYLRVSHMSFFLIFKKVILDFHGVVPEELKFEKLYLKSIFFQIIEFFAVFSSWKLIYVTYSMKEYLESKYFWLKYKKSVVLPIVPQNEYVCDTNEINLLKEKYNIVDTDIVFIYSGNLQKWQNIDLMLNSVKEICSLSHLKFIFLTNDMKNMQKKIIDYRLDNCKNIYIDSVNKDKLGVFYSIATYGFILRDFRILNKVSNPTKLSEYLMYGIIPIVLSDEIGDYKKYGYENIFIQDLLININNINNKLSDINQNILKKQKESFNLLIKSIYS
jgi:hypothetical protein